MVFQEHEKNSVALYQRIALSFVILTLLLVGIVVYLSFSQATIVVIPKEEIVSTSFITTLSQGEKVSEDEIEARFFQEIFSGEIAATANGKKKVETDMIGAITLYNNYNKEQVLVVNTRLLTPKGELFRLRNRASVPSGGKLDGVEIYADDISKISFPIAPSRMIIPGLWEGLQDKIYGESTEEWNGNLKEVSIVTADDIEKAKTDLKTKLLNEAKNKWNATLKEEGVIFSLEIQEGEIQNFSQDAQAGDQQSNFIVTFSLEVIGVAFEKEKLKAMAFEKIQKELDEDKELDGVDISTFSFQLVNYDQEEKTGQVQVYLEGVTRLRLESPILSKENFLGKTKKEVTAFLTASSTILDVKIDLRPFWLTRVPRLLDHINIVIKRTE